MHMKASKKILFVRVGRVGDIVMITAALNAAIKLYPDAEIHVLTGADGKRVLRNFSNKLTEIILYDRRVLIPYFQRKKIKKKIASENYDDIFCMETNPSYLKLFSGSNARQHVMQNYDVKQNYAKQCMQLVTHAANKDDVNEWISLPVIDDADKLARDILKEQSVTDEDFVIAIHPSFSGLRKRAFRSQVARHQRGWPLANFAKLAQLFHEYLEKNNIKHAIITDLLEDERDIGEELVKQSCGVVKLFTPAMNFERYKATLKRCDLIITPNTGPLHIAAAVGAPVLGLFAGLTPDDSGAYVDAKYFRAVCAEDMPAPELGLEAISPEAAFAASLQFLPSK